jgi:DNA polymerase II
MDKGIKGSLEIEGDFKKGSFVNRIYEEPKLNPVFFKPELRVIAIDIETSMDLKYIYSLSLYSKNFSKVLVVSNKKLKNAESFEDEKSLLERFKEIIHNYDPDIITGWNIIDFDFKILKEKFDYYNVDFNLGRTDWPGTIRLNSSFFKDSSLNLPGRVVLDAMTLLRISFIRLSDFKLQTAAEEILGESKLNVFDDVNKGKEIERLYKEETQKLVDYNLKDSELVIKILEKKGIIDMTIERSLLTGMQLDRVKSSIASLDNLYIRETKKIGYVCKTSDFKERTARIKGGYVKDSTPGIYDYIIVLDFKSLYPSIMRTFNIDPLSFIPKELHKKYNEDEVITAPNGAKFKKEYGILPNLLQKLWEERDKAKKENNKEKSYAIKITMNSFFGVLANPMCRFYSLDMANAITHFAQFIIKTSAEIVEKKGYNVIYGDTDSIFVETKSKNIEESQKIGSKIENFVNRYWNEYTKKIGVENKMELQFEKTYVRFMMPKIRGTDIGAKKRYAGLIIKDGKEKIDFTGLEFVRRDWTDVSKKFQLELLDKIFHKKEVFSYIKEFVDKLKKGSYDDLLVYKKAIRKDLDKYTKTTPPHVKAARKLDKITSSIIAYVLTTDGPEPIQKITHSLDYDHYIEKQIKPIADSILVFYNTTFDDVVNETKQTSLFNFEKN